MGDSISFLFYASAQEQNKRISFDFFVLASSEPLSVQISGSLETIRRWFPDSRGRVIGLLRWTLNSPDRKDFARFSKCHADAPPPQ